MSFGGNMDVAFYKETLTPFLLLWEIIFKTGHIHICQLRVVVDRFKFFKIILQPAKGIFLPIQETKAPHWQTEIWEAFNEGSELNSQWTDFGVKGFSWAVKYLEAPSWRSANSPPQTQITPLSQHHNPFIIYHHSHSAINHHLPSS